MKHMKLLVMNKRGESMIKQECQVMNSNRLLQVDLLGDLEGLTSKDLEDLTSKVDLEALIKTHLVISLKNLKSSLEDKEDLISKVGKDKAKISLKVEISR